MSALWFNRIAKWSSHHAGQPVAFALSIFLILAWIVTGPLFRYSDTWQLTINTFTTVVTFLMVFLIQNTQNRYSEAMQIKLDELIRATHGAHNALLNLEELTDRDLERIKESYEELALRAREDVREGGQDTDVPTVEAGVAGG